METNDFDQWFAEYTQCNFCRMSREPRIYASNAWYVQQGKIDSLRAQLAKCIQQRDNELNHIGKHIPEDQRAINYENELLEITRGYL